MTIAHPLRSDEKGSLAVHKMACDFSMFLLNTRSKITLFFTRSSRRTTQDNGGTSDSYETEKQWENCVWRSLDLHILKNQIHW